MNLIDLKRIVNKFSNFGVVFHYGPVHFSNQYTAFKNFKYI